MASSGRFLLLDGASSSGRSTLARRLHARLDDRTPREGRAHGEVDRIHEHGPYHLTVDTTAGVTDSVVSTVVEAWQYRL